MYHQQQDGLTLGICGDGQLSRLLASKARDLHLPTIIYTLDAISSPCFGDFVLWEGKSWDDIGSLQRFVYLCDVIILENEFIPAELIIWADSLGKKIIPNAKSYTLIDNKAKQVQIAQSCGINIPHSQIISDSKQLSQIQLPLMLKSLTGGYDGYGNFTLKDTSLIEEASFFINKHGTVLAQELISFDNEVAILVARDQESIATFPIVETIQENSICHYVISPPLLPLETLEKIEQAAIKIIKAIDGIGLFGIEFFICKNEVIFNEIAPRPHNSGHFSIEACDYSQFEAIIKIALDLPLKPNHLKVPVVGMLNLLGNRIGKASFEADESFFNNSNGALHLYGKKESKIGRKMGHYTLTGTERDTLLAELKDLKQRYQT